jgi:hypothetical protein
VGDIARMDQESRARLHFLDLADGLAQRAKSIRISRFIETDMAVADLQEVLKPLRRVRRREGPRISARHPTVPIRRRSRPRSCIQERPDDRPRSRRSYSSLRKSSSSP